MDERLSGQIAARKAIQMIGGPVKAAAVLQLKGRRHQTVQSWLKTRVPAEHCPTIERATAGAVRCEELRPDVDWAVLRESTIRPPCGVAQPQEAGHAG